MCIRDRGRTGRVRQPVERLTYNRLGATHQLQDGTKKVSFTNNKLEMCHNIMTDDNTHERVEYSPDKADIIARIMVQIHEGVAEKGFGFIQEHANRNTNSGASVKSALEQYAQQYVYEKGIKLFRERGEQAATKEWDQFHRRKCFVPVDIASLTEKEKKRAQQAVMLLTEKRNGDIKGRAVYNGKPMREWLSREDTTSPTTFLCSDLSEHYQRCVH